MRASPPLSSSTTVGTPLIPWQLRSQLQLLTSERDRAHQAAKKADEEARARREEALEARQLGTSAQAQAQKCETFLSTRPVLTGPAQPVPRPERAVSSDVVSRYEAECAALREKEAAAQRACIEAREREASEAKRAAAAAATGSAHASQAAAAASAVHAAQAERDAALINAAAAKAAAEEKETALSRLGERTSKRIDALEREAAEAAREANGARREAEKEAAASGAAAAEVARLGEKLRAAEQQVDRLDAASGLAQVEAERRLERESTALEQASSPLHRPLAPALLAPPWVPPILTLPSVSRPYPTCCLCRSGPRLRPSAIAPRSSCGARCRRSRRPMAT